MKPHPRVTRTKWSDRLDAEPERSGKCRWHRDEKKKLVVALKRLNSGTAAGKTDIDCAFLRKYLPTRSLSEIQSVVELLKNKVLLNARLKLKRQRREERKVRKPIEEWTYMASSLVGTLEETISTAFSQMLIVSSTEPCTLRNCDPPQVHRPPTDGPTIPLRPMLVPVQGAHRYTKAVQSPKTPAPTTMPSKTPPASQTASLTATPEKGPLQPTSRSSTSPSLIRSINKTTQQPTTIAITSTSQSLSSSLNVPASCSATTLTSAPRSLLSTVASSAISSCSTPTTLPQSVSATALHAKFGRTSKYATKDMFGVKCVVDFERIYGFLSTVQKPNQDCQLTPMESAIVLDLLMSLPEELPLLDCNKLHKHMIQMYQCLSAPTDSDLTRRRFQELDDELFTQLKALVPQDHQNPTGTTDSTNVTDGEGKKSLIHKADSQSTQSSTTFSKLDYSNVTPPHLNPFIVPLTLLKRRQESIII
ncbi:snRNA-activating protein complex subunit 2 isoform X2 [Neolamprologus brichardi]|uniref:snRNA-activating protein complex subunit 2 isoform X2 n=1 Tax=Neolamprologus brichardi TaxID=32507 RepID=UPI001643D89C|nr:snRNA-activating protein complex subunit 2 isoform X2 [Neolamprologus brichardi]